MTRQRGPRVRAVPPAAALVATLVGLGLVVPPAALASCVGPQIVLVQAGTTVTPAPPPEDGAGPGPHVVDPDEVLHISGSHLTTVCNDTVGSTTLGCSGPRGDVGDPVVPLEDTRLTLVQRGRSWELGTFGDIGPDLSAQVAVRLPDEVQPGPAQLVLSEGPSDPVSFHELVIA